MGRKRLTKPCTHCSKECERKQFSRSMWEKEEEQEHQQLMQLGVSLAFERVCRQCQYEQKKSREQETLAVASPSLSLGEGRLVLPPVVAAASAALGARLSFGMTPSPACLPMAIIAPPSPLVLATAGAAMPSLSVPMLDSHHEGNNNSNNNDDEDLFDGVDLDQFLVGDDNLKEKRSTRAKKRRAKMNSLFNALASDVGLPGFADRAKVLERTREVIKELRGSMMNNNNKRVKSLSSSAMPSMSTQPVVSMLDVMNEHLSRASQESFVSHSHCA